MSIELNDRVNTAAFLDRLLRLDSAALVRLRPAEVVGDGRSHLTLWGALPWNVLVSRTVAGRVREDSTVSAADLRGLNDLADGSSPTRRDGQWRIALPPATLREVESLPGAVVRKMAAAAAATLRQAEASGVRGKAVGQRVLRDVLLDHPVVTGQSDVDGVSFMVPQRLVQAVTRMGFLVSDDEAVVIGVAGRWTALAATFGTAWTQTEASLAIRPASK